MHFDPPDTILTLRMRLLRDVHEGTAFKDSLPSTKALPLWLGLAMVVEGDGSDSTF